MYCKSGAEDFKLTYFRHMPVVNNRQNKKTKTIYEALFTSLRCTSKEPDVHTNQVVNLCFSFLRGGQIYLAFPCHFDLEHFPLNLYLFKGRGEFRSVDYEGSADDSSQDES